jgi:hypothetical protein
LVIGNAEFGHRFGQNVSMKSFLSVFLAFFLFTVGCSKSDDEPNPNEYTVEYRVTGATNRIVQATIRNADEVDVAADVSAQGGASWSQSIQVDQKPFPAHIRVAVFNPSPTAFSYVVQILVDGAVKQTSSGVANNGANSVVDCDYTVQ